MHKKMASHSDSSFMPTLFKIALGKVAISLYDRFHYGMLEKAYTDIQRELTTSFHERSEFDNETFDMVYPDEYIECGSSKTFKGEGKEELEGSYNEAKESLFFIPEQFRKEVLDAVKNMHDVAFQWREDYLGFLNLNDEDCTLHWRSDGTIDANKTALEIVLNEKIDFERRFQTACAFCFKEFVVQNEIISNIKTYDSSFYCPLY